MRTPVPPYGQGPKNPSKSRTVRLEYVLPLAHTKGAHISSTITLDWNTFVDMVDEHDENQSHDKIMKGPFEGFYQGLILHEIFTYYKAGVRLPTKPTCRDTLIKHNEDLMMKICTVNNYTFSAVLC